MIQSSWTLVGCRSSESDGTARCSTVRSIAYTTHASASTASPIHSRRPALGALLDDGHQSMSLRVIAWIATRHITNPKATR